MIESFHDFFQNSKPTRLVKCPLCNVEQELFWPWNWVISHSNSDLVITPNSKGTPRWSLSWAIILASENFLLYLILWPWLPRLKFLHCYWNPSVVGQVTHAKRPTAQTNLILLPPKDLSLSIVQISRFKTLLISWFWRLIQQHPPRLSFSLLHNAWLFLAQQNLALAWEADSSWSAALVRQQLQV